MNKPILNPKTVTNDVVTRGPLPGSKKLLVNGVPFREVALSGGERKMVSIASALALDPEMLLLDEPTEGLSPAIVPSIVEGLANIRSFGRAVFMAESNMHHVPDFADRLYVLERGEIIFAGRLADARHDPAVLRVIEGTGAAVA